MDSKFLADLEQVVGADGIVRNDAELLTYESDGLAKLRSKPGVAVLPHHERRDQAETSRELQKSAPEGLTLLGIDTRTGCLGTPKNWRVVGFGRVTVYQGSEWQVFNAGDTLRAGF